MTRLTFGKRLREIRKQKGLDQLALALQAGYENASTISKIEKGQLDVPLSSILALAQALEVPASAFFHEPDTSTITLSRKFVKDIQHLGQTIVDDITLELLKHG